MEYLARRDRPIKREYNCCCRMMRCKQTLPQMLQHLLCSPCRNDYTQCAEVRDLIMYEYEYEYILVR
ncbi:hypothetical protein BD777DRAFT_123236 [Yarrowia lipolytica]|nr:hypothetical protein BD777DRAFT_123236 [Yarrowia lipolytica]